MSIPAIIVAGTHSGSGKTTVTLAIMAALVRRGMRVQGFKVGPDFIDPGHHSRITGRTSRNLDTWMIPPPALARTFRRGADGADVAIIEGVMGLFDGLGGVDEAGSTADLARQWNLPVVLVVDARGMARSIAPLAAGFANFDPEVQVAAVIANRVGSHRHYEEYLAPSLKSSLPSVKPAGFMARNEALALPSRHLGLITADECSETGPFEDALAEAAEATVDLDRLLALARGPTLPPEGPGRFERPTIAKRVAQARDPAFCFYYEDNIDALRDAGAEVMTFSPLEDRELPEGIDLIYLGGGYPELFAERLSANAPMHAAIRCYHDKGGAIFAECGGLMACAESLRDVSGRTHRMWGLVPAQTAMLSKFAALGYVTAVADRATLLGPAGTAVRGHEFHYSALEASEALPYATSLVRRNHPPKPDGIQIGGLLAGYAHLHFGSNPDIAANLLSFGAKC